jgi:hypothetical protein
MYYRGEGVNQDYSEAAKWYNDAAYRGDAKAQYNLGLMFGKGEGVQQDYVKEYMWLSLSSAQGEKNAAKSLAVLTGMMTPEQIAEANKLVNEWKPKK